MAAKVNWTKLGVIATLIAMGSALIGAYMDKTYVQVRDAATRFVPREEYQKDMGTLKEWREENTRSHDKIEKGLNKVYDKLMEGGY